MRQLFIFLLFTATTASIAQTKKIAFKSHSGSNENFSIALEDNLFDMGESNFGLPSTKEIFTKTLDSVICLADNITVLVITNYSTETSPLKGRPVNNGSVNDTVYNHPLFSQKHSLDSIRSVLKSRNEYQNPVQKIIFVGFDNKKAKKVKRNELLVPIVINNNSDGGYNAVSVNTQSAPFDTSVVWIVGAIVILSLLSGFVAWKYAESREATPLLSAS